MIIKNKTYNMLNKCRLINNSKTEVIDYVYERQSEEDIQTYSAIRNEQDIILLSPLQHYYFSILGERTIEKLEGKGYLSIEEFNQKYEGSTVERAPQKQKRR